VTEGESQLNGTVILNDELERMWKEAVVTYIKALSQHFTTGTLKNHENFSIKIAGNLENNLNGTPPSTSRYRYIILLGNNKKRI
jgi:hypothetical protein